MRASSAPLAALACSLAFSSSASAQTQRGFALDRFDPSERGSEWFVLDSLDLRGHLRPAAGIIGSFAYDALAVYDGRDRQVSSLVEQQVFVHPGASLVLWDRARGSLSVPIAVYQTGESVVARGKAYSAPSSAIGDLRLAGDVRLFGEHGGPITGALGVAVHLPTGSREDYTSDGYVRLSPRASVAGDLSRFTYAARLGFQYRALTERFERNPLGSELTGGVAAGVRLANGDLVVGPELWASTIVDGRSFFKRRGTPIEALLGAHFAVADFRFGAGVGPGLTRGWGTPALRAFLGAEWTPAYREPAPPAPVAIAKEPRAPEAREACADPAAEGCAKDRDRDGVLDEADACPDLPGVASADPGKNGCPPDRDGDGVPDDKDACPDVPGATSEDPLRSGCPADHDDDGVPDDEDACPDAPGPADTDAKKNGCPLARIEGGEIKIVEQVRFKTGSAEILRDSDPTLFAVATMLKTHPEITKVRVEGHTDDKGSARTNDVLSQRRAESVVKWLTAYGIDDERFEAKGFGFRRPLDTNTTEVGRQNNRRVEFHIAAEAAPAP